MVECKKCLHYDTCVKQFNERKAEGYYDEECPDITIEEHFANIAECDSCDFFYDNSRDKKQYPVYLPRTELPGPPSRVACPNCYETLYAFDKYCHNCGQAIDWNNVIEVEAKSNDS